MLNEFLDLVDAMDKLERYAAKLPEFVEEEGLPGKYLNPEKIDIQNFFARMRNYINPQESI